MQPQIKTKLSNHINFLIRADLPKEGEKTPSQQFQTHIGLFRDIQYVFHVLLTLQTLPCISTLSSQVQQKPVMNIGQHHYNCSSSQSSALFHTEGHVFVSHPLKYVNSGFLSQQFLILSSTA